MEIELPGGVRMTYDDVGEGKCILGWRKGHIGHGEHTQSSGSGRPQSVAGVLDRYRLQRVHA